MSGTDQAMLVSRTPITACTRCGRTIDQVTAASRCRHDALGEHTWWTGSHKDWFASWSDKGH